MDSFDYLARRLVRSLRAWEDEFRDLLQAVAVATALANGGSLNERDLESWCELHGLPQPDFKAAFHLPQRDGEWTYHRDGEWRLKLNPRVQKGFGRAPRRRQQTA